MAAEQAATGQGSAGSSRLAGYPPGPEAAFPLGPSASPIPTQAPGELPGIGTSADTRRPAWLDTSGHRRGRWAVAPRERVNGPSATTPIAANAGIRGTASGARPLEFRTADPVTPHHDPYLSFLTFRELSVRLRLAWSKAMQSLFNLDALLAGSGPG
jgi:hypothetical protein